MLESLWKSSGPILYKYPEATIHTVTNIAHQLLNNREFYVRVCHLMNLMCLDPPFDSKYLPYTRQRVTKQQLRQKIAAQEGPLPKSEEAGSDEDADDLSMDYDDIDEDNQLFDKLIEEGKVEEDTAEALHKAKVRNLVRAGKKAKYIRQIERIKRRNVPARENAMRSVDSVPLAVKSKSIHKERPINIELNLPAVPAPDREEEKEEETPKAFRNNLAEAPQIFDTRPVLALDLDKITVPQQPAPEEEKTVQIAGEKNAGQEEKRPAPAQIEEADYNIWYGNREVLDIPDQEEMQDESETFVCPKTLAELRASRADAGKMKRFSGRNISSEPTKKLYLKNLAKRVQPENVKELISVILRDCGLPHQDAHVDVKVMKKGRMRGQGFVELADKETARRVKEELNGYMIFEKPLVVEYSKSN